MKDSRLTQIAINIEQQRQWVTRVTWAAMSDPDHSTRDIQILGVVEQLLQEVHHLVKMVDE